jgi:beta-glucosidase
VSLCVFRAAYLEAFKQSENILYTPGADLEIEDQTAIEKAVEHWDASKIILCLGKKLHRNARRYQ